MSLPLPAHVAGDCDRARRCVKDVRYAAALVVAPVTVPMASEAAWAAEASMENSCAEWISVTCGEGGQKAAC
jgi:hypothetical protein